jgi:type IV secretory pathway VirB10-like protein
MFSNRLAFVLLALACVSAAAGGGYLATRQNAVPVPAAAQSSGAVQPASSVATPPASPAPAAAADRPAVQETEAVVGDSSPRTPASSSSRRADAPPPRPSQRDARPGASSTARRDSTGAASRPQSKQGTLTSTWPSSAQQAPTAPAAPEPPAPRPDEHQTTEPARPAEPPRPTIEELVVSRDSVIGVQTENRISSETARLEDRVDARVTRDVRVGDRVAIPAGSRVIGSVTLVERGGKFKEQARLGIRFHTIVLGDGTRLNISTETITRLGDAPGNSSAAKIGGGAVGGAIIGAILGGGKGAAIGATAGAGAGTAAVQAGDRSAAVLAPGTPLTARILSPVTVTVERE